MQINLRLLVNRLKPNPMTLLHRLPGQTVDLRISRPDKLAFSGAGSNNHLQLVRIIIGRSYQVTTSAEARGFTLVDPMQRVKVVSRRIKQLPTDVTGSLQPLLPTTRVRIKPRILDRDPGRRGKGQDQLLVFGREGGRQRGRSSTDCRTRRDYGSERPGMWSSVDDQLGNRTTADRLRSESARSAWDHRSARAQYARVPSQLANRLDNVIVHAHVQKQLIPYGSRKKSAS